MYPTFRPLEDLSMRALIKKDLEGKDSTLLLASAVQTFQLILSGMLGMIQKRVELIPLNRFGTATECADLITFLLSSESSYMTGQAINISGGWITS